jgi:hypothetical protein|tara:strand:- start:871 stop:1236 length:366 start_codon:yes stop_codon:yes gene_type:complete
MLFDNSFRGSKRKTKNQDFDYKKILLEEKKINKDFLNRIKILSIEEILYLKLDSITASLNGKLFGFPIMKMLPEICHEAFVTYALSATKNKTEACVMLGMTKQQLNNLIKKYKLNQKEENL